MGHESNATETTITAKTTTLVFSYGTLKRGFSNHVLMQDLIRSGDASFKGVYQTLDMYPLVCGPYRVPFLLNKPGSGQRVTGELYAVSPRGLSRLDELEGTSRGHYVRQPIRLLKEEGGGDDLETEHALSCVVEAYYAHKSYEEELWERNRRRSFGAYTEKEARGYVKRNDRPQHLSFLDHIRIFVSSPCD
ncbi:putative gamma-glutamylcyclotransferase [Raphanus sativus]|uniref:Gamma-glutamylcyclotransferase family protein n=1 Tax=Raphanus sativus TaxID=3726 RepID=A0A9W3C3I6_RAPSA|nr:putative gamma-glutamylcyclotransferase At3g02910 [Raphanus sativus]KAJ4886289.1 putative gamma-glutamylcyclotransferase [Raphanus sativus]